MYRPYIQGWINDYSHFYKSALTWTLHRIDAFLIRWACNKFKRLRRRPQGAREWLAQVIIRTCLRSGAFCMAMAEHREPYDARVCAVKTAGRILIQDERSREKCFWVNHLTGW